MRGWCSSLVLIILAAVTTATAAVAQPAQRPRVLPRAHAPQSRVPLWRAPPGLMQNGRVAMPVAANLHLGVGRYSVVEPARPRSHTEPISRTSDIARRDRGIAAVGLSLRF